MAAGGRGVTEITNLANMMYSEGRFPEQMYKSIFITIPKVKGTAKCKKNRTISLMSHVTKLVLRVIMNRLRWRTLSEISEVQYGFLPDLYLYKERNLCVEKISRKNDREAERCQATCKPILEPTSGSKTQWCQTGSSAGMHFVTPSI